MKKYLHNLLAIYTPMWIMKNTLMKDSRYGQKSNFFSNHIVEITKIYSHRGWKSTIKCDGSQNSVNATSLVKTLISRKKVIAFYCIFPHTMSDPFLWSSFSKFLNVPHCGIFHVFLGSGLSSEVRVFGFSDLALMYNKLHFFVKLWVDLNM